MFKHRKRERGEVSYGAVISVTVVVVMGLGWYALSLSQKSEANAKSVVHSAIVSTVKTMEKTGELSPADKAQLAHDLSGETKYFVQIDATPGKAQKGDTVFVRAQVYGTERSLFGAGKRVLITDEIEKGTYSN